MAIGNHTLHPVLSFRPEARSHHDLSTGEVLLDLVPELAPKAVNIRKLCQVFSTNDNTTSPSIKCAERRRKPEPPEPACRTS